MNKYKKLGKNTVLFMIGNFAQKLLGFVFVPIYTAVLSTEEYGTADLIVTIISMLWPVFTIVINEACFRFLLDRQIENRRIVTIGFWINITGIMLVLVFSPIILFFSSLKSYFILFVIYFILYTFDSFLTYAVRGLEMVNDYVFGGIINTVTTISCNLLFLIVLKWGTKGYLLGFIVGMLASDIWYICKTKILTSIQSPKKMDKQLLHDMVQYSLPLIPNSVSWWISNSADRILVTYFCGIAMNGIYSVAYKIPSLLSVISSVFMSAWQISSVDDFGTEENRKFFSSVYRKYAAINIVMVSGIICFVKVISRILFSNEFYEAYQIAPYLLVGALFKTLSAFLGTIYTAAKKTQMVFYSTVGGALLNIVLNIILLKRVGVLGAAIATLASYFVVWIVRFIDTRKIIRLDVNIKREAVLYLVLIFQILIITFGASKGFYLELLLLCVVLFFERNEWVPMIRMTWKKVREK